MNEHEHKIWVEGFEAGYCGAVAQIMRLHNKEEIARDVLWSGCPRPIDHIDISDKIVLTPLWDKINKKW